MAEEEDRKQRGWEICHGLCHRIIDGVHWSDGHRGGILDGLLGDYSTLAVKSVLDFIIIAVMTSSMGKGCAFALGVLTTPHVTD